jgi:hypothetical protein
LRRACCRRSSISYRVNIRVLVFHLALGDPPTLQKRDLLGRKVELAIMRSEVHELEDGLEQTVLYEDRLWVVAGASSPWAARRKVGLVDLVQERWCLPPPDHPVGALVIKAFDRAGLAAPERTVTVASAQCTSNLVARGQYLGVLGSLFLQFNPPSVQLKVLPVTFPVTAPPINIVTLKQRAQSPVARMFVEFVRKVAKPTAKAGRARRPLSRSWGCAISALGHLCRFSPSHRLFSHSCGQQQHRDVFVGWPRLFDNAISRAAEPWQLAERAARDADIANIFAS